MIERYATISVEGTMTRTRTVFISLIPALWLVAAMNCFGATPTPCNHRPLHSVVLTTAHCSHDLAQLDNSFDQAVRRAGRRINIQPSEDDFHAPGFTESSLFASTRTAGPTLRLPADLAQRWQFLWRTALEPRAPSSIS